MAEALSDALVPASESLLDRRNAADSVAHNVVTSNQLPDLLNALLQQSHRPQKSPSDSFAQLLSTLQTINTRCVGNKLPYC